MMRLEQMAAAVVCALMTISDYPDPDNVITHCGSIQGPTPVLGGQDPQAATVVSAPFTARVDIGLTCRPRRSPPKFAPAVNVF